MNIEFSTFIFVMLAIIIVGCIWYLASAAKQAEEEQKEKDEAAGIFARAIVDHTAGLPLADGTKCIIVAYEDHFNITAIGAEFDLAKHKVVNIEIRTETEIHKSYVSSAGGAVGGAILFGAVGALIGGRVQQKIDTIEHKYLIITYKKEDSLEYIGFDCTQNLTDAYSLISYYRTSTPYQSVKIEL